MVEEAEFNKQGRDREKERERERIFWEHISYFSLARVHDITALVVPTASQTTVPLMNIE